MSGWPPGYTAESIDPVEVTELVEIHLRNCGMASHLRSLCGSPGPVIFFYEWADVVDFGKQYALCVPCFTLLLEGRASRA